MPIDAQAQEDAEVLRSLVVPLEEEIKVLKEKLRNCDDQLQSYRGGAVGGVTESALVGMLKERQIAIASPIDASHDNLDTTNATAPPCTQCNSLQNQLVAVQKELTDCRHDCDGHKRDIDRYKEELHKEGALRTDLEQQWQDKRETHKAEVEMLSEKVIGSERQLRELQQRFGDAKDDIEQQLLSVISEREDIHRHLNTLQNDNDFLAGKYLATSDELQSQRIDLPNTVEELQELLLKCHESLIEARVGCEFEQRKCVCYLDEAQVLRDQLTAMHNDRQNYEKENATRIRTLE